MFKSYPAGSLERGEEGTVGFVAAVERSGDLKSCRVTKTSGYALLDRATCDMLIANARFTPDKAVHGDKPRLLQSGTALRLRPRDKAFQCAERQRENSSALAVRPAMAFAQD